MFTGSSSFRTQPVFEPHLSGAQHVPRPVRCHMAKALLMRLLLLAAVLCVLPASASADWYLTKHGAQRATAAAVESRYGISRIDVYASCRPQSASRRSASKYHRWVCRWDDISFYPAGQEPCSSRRALGGTLVIVGSGSKGFRHRVTRGKACRPFLPTN